MTREYLMSESGADNFTSATRSILDAISNDVAALSRTFPSLECELPPIVDSLYALGTLLDTPDSPCPASCFDIEGWGHFKECFTFSPSLVIKFCAKRNPTAEEMKALQDAKENGLGYLFLPTFYYPLPIELTSSELEVDDDDAEIYSEEQSSWIENPEWEDNTILTWVCIQMRAETADRHLYNPNGSYLEKDSDLECNLQSHWSETRQTLGLPANERSYDWRGLGGVCLLWARDFARMYGTGLLRQFSNFCEEFHIWDLHSENVGYSLPDENGVVRPIILDWMSRQNIPNSVLCHKD